MRGRNSDSELILQQLGWEPTIKLEDGLRITYAWIKEQLAAEVGNGRFVCYLACLPVCALRA